MTTTSALDSGPLAGAATGAMSIRARLSTFDKPWSVALVAIVALALRIPALGYGLPYVWHPDEPGNVLTAARMVDNGTLNPHNFIYPSTIYYLIAAFAWVQKLFGGWHPLAGIVGPNTGIAITADPGLFIALRVVTVLLSVGVCVLVWVAVSVVVKRWWAATLAALLVAVAPIMVTNGVFITPDMYSAFFAAAAVLAAIAILRRGSRRDYVLAGVAVGMAAGTKYNVAIVAASVAVAHVLRIRQRGDPSTRAGDAPAASSPVPVWSRPVAPLVYAGVVAIITFAVTTPAAFIDPRDFYHQSTFIAHGYATVHVPGTPASPMAYYVSLYADQGVIFAVFGIAAIYSLFGKWWRESLVMWAFVVCYVGLIGLQKTAFSRNILPAMPALAILAGIGLVTAAERWRLMARRPQWVWIAGAALAFIGLVQPVASSLRVPGQLQQHPNFEAQHWIYTHVPNRTTILEESYGPYIQPLRYRALQVFLLLETKARNIPRTTRVIIVTELGSGRFLSDPKAYPAQLADYRSITRRYCLAASFSDGPWVHILVPCRARPPHPRG